MSYRTIAHHASSVRLTTSEVPVAGKGIFQTIYPEVLAFRQGTSPPSAKGTISPNGVTTTDPYEVAEAEGHAIRVVGVVIVGVSRTVHIAEIVGVAAIRRTLPPVVRRTING